MFFQSKNFLQTKKHNPGHIKRPMNPFMVCFDIHKNILICIKY